MASQDRNDLTSSLRARGVHNRLQVRVRRGRRGAAALAIGLAAQALLFPAVAASAKGTRNGWIQGQPKGLAKKAGSAGTSPSYTPSTPKTTKSNKPTTPKKTSPGHHVGWAQHPDRHVAPAPPTVTRPNPQKGSRQHVRHVTHQPQAQTTKNTKTTQPVISPQVSAPAETHQTHSRANTRRAHSTADKKPSSQTLVRHVEPLAPPRGWLNDVGEAASQTSRKLAFPLVIILVVLAFLLMQNRLDRKDPKLALAPVNGGEEFLSFE